MPATEGSSPADLPGAWTVVPGANSFAGYRVVETLASFGTNTAAGRTTAIERKLQFDGQAIHARRRQGRPPGADSDQSERDESLRTQAIETDVYPAARFVLTSRTDVRPPPANGEPAQRNVRGDLTLHGVTREVELTVEAALRACLLWSAARAKAASPTAESSSLRRSACSRQRPRALEFQLVFVRRERRLPRRSERQIASP